MNKIDFQKHLIYTTLTRNATTLYACENVQLVHALSKVNCSEIIAQELGLINASKTLIGSTPAISSGSNIELALYFIKKSLSNADGSSDLITVVTIAHVNMNRALVLSVLKKIMDKYIEFKQDLDSASEGSKSKLGEFKLYMSQIIKFEEMNYDSNSGLYNYGSITPPRDEEETSGDEVIGPRSLVLVNEEVEEVRQLMLDNINKLMNRGDKINLLVDQTDRLTNSSSVFQKRAQLIKRRMWLSGVKFYLMLAFGFVFILYLILTSACGFPFLSHCIHR
ncbi:hypothetical protein PSN45_003180 [Yamadazyma tenuis]|uniref:V-SNARE coiled-coil homology domain-containing protein n=1 Tax=Candida tenuis (strain ATCC 10573 / BCRC 21748 / CBS 615 / JCM 9827 / NBRC 10315 / NRRL Y-1498 / VKM Y-70) TaxID=590646 RepID=G3AZ44_CANTC|nr:uncharacterized protein CANTEDRAFT_119049 [Yamadazyma tenuis ATCC 10573]EGV66005.1 hypothetical protein CANTEDRAFT_119049 [Yamadazyma tenuis ATCC 10573]WEJ95656.1 hypothetical protein PSN45_003180 [Yamadazyma tenuis]